MSEKTIEDAVKRYCEAEGFVYLKLELKRSRGFPDRTILLPNGVAIFLELKQPGGRLSFHQSNWIKRLRLHGLAAAAVDNLEDAIEFIEGQT